MLIMILLILLLMLFIVSGCAVPAKLRYMQIPERFEFDDYGHKIWHYNDHNILSGCLTWDEAQILGVDSVIIRYIEYENMK